MATVTDLATALGTALGIAEIRALPYLSDTFSPPVALVGIDQIEYHQSFGGSGGLGMYRFIVYVLLARSSDRAGLTSLEGYMSSTGTTSILDALEADQTLGGIADAVVVVRSGPPASVGINGAEYISCPFEVHVYA